MVASVWQWSFSHMLINFGWKAAFGIFLANSIYFLRYRKELFSLSPERIRRGAETRPIPKRIMLMHVLFMVWVVATEHYPFLVIVGFLFYFAFGQSTALPQEYSAFRGPPWVGSFL